MRGYKSTRSGYRSHPISSDSSTGLSSQNPVRYLPLFIFLGIASIGVLTIDVRGGFDRVNEFVSRISDPLVLALDQVIRPVSSSWVAVHETFSAKSENEMLRERVAALEKDNLDLEEALAENQRYRDLLNLKAEVAPSSMVAQVLRYVDLPGKKLLVLRAGEEQGLQVGQPILSPSNQLFGRIIETAPSSSIVRLILDPTSKVRVTLDRTGAQGTLYSQGDQLYLRIDRGESLRVGDLIVTSHLSTAYPEGLTIGRVAELSDDPEGDPMVAVEMGLMKNSSGRDSCPTQLRNGDSFREVLCLPVSSPNPMLEKEAEE